MNAIAIQQQDQNSIVNRLSVHASQFTTCAKIVEDWGGHSLDAMELVMALGEGFSCEESVQDAEELRSVGDVIKYIEAH